jgi:hypothetical protein
MKKAPYSLAEAEKLCREYQFLVGRSFASDSDAVIECVTVTPFDEISRKRFLIFYFLFNNAQSALSHEYKGLLYDILVIARSVDDEHELLQEDLTTWLNENKQDEDPDLGQSISATSSQI